MGVPLEQVVPWGRSFQEYLAMFALSEADLRRRILGCADGPAAFNAELSARGGTAVSADPIYAFSAEDIRTRVRLAGDVILKRLQNHLADYVWDTIRSPEELGRMRLAAMEEFLEDFPGGARAGRYVAAELPRLPFCDRAFDLAVCSHFLFTYSDQLSTAFHVDAILEMCRVATEVRVFPILATSNAVSPHLPPLREELARRGYATAIRTVPYHFQVGGDQMLVVTRE